MAAGSVMKDPRIGAMIRTLNHHAPGEPFPRLAATAITRSANRKTGRLAAIAMITATNSGSVKFRSLLR